MSEERGRGNRMKDKHEPQAVRVRQHQKERLADSTNCRVKVRWSIGMFPQSLTHLSDSDMD